MQKIYESNNSTVYIGKHDDFSGDVIIKRMNTDYPTEEQIIRFTNEYEFTKTDIQGVRKALKISLENSRHLLILEYFEGQTLNKFIEENNCSVPELILVGVSIAQAIGNIQFQKNIPYHALVQAFTDFANLILKENDEKLNYWKNLIQNSAGNVGQVLTNLIPELELIIGKQPMRIMP